MDEEKTFPSFRRQNKWLGIIDYKSLIVFVIYVFVIYQICNLINLSTTSLVTVLIVSIIPLFALYFVNSKEESIIDIVYIILRFYLSNKIYYYKLEKREEFEINIKRKKKFKINLDKLLRFLRI